MRPNRRFAPLRFSHSPLGGSGGNDHVEFTAIFLHSQEAKGLSFAPLSAAAFGRDFRTSVNYRGHKQIQRFGGVSPAHPLLRFYRTGKARLGVLGVFRGPFAAHPGTNALADNPAPHFGKRRTGA